jgi:DNA-directed RNA polymerase subunit alpha
MELLEKGQDAVMSIRNFGDKSMDELVDNMREKGYLIEGKAVEEEE